MFYITVSNGLLVGKHQKKMGASVWQFMWCLDKITKIDDEEMGWVLGGKPINLADIKGASRNTVSRNLNKLEKAGYLNLIHTPYGISIRVIKAKKRFNKSGEPLKKRLPINGEPLTNNGEPRNDNGEPNKIVSIDSISKTVSVLATPSVADINPLIELFKPINPSYKELYANITQRKSLQRVVISLGFEKTEQVLKLLPKTNSMQYAPSITTPHQLEQKLGQLIAFLQKEKTKSQEHKIVKI